MCLKLVCLYSISLRHYFLFSLRGERSEKNRHSKKNVISLSNLSFCKVFNYSKVFWCFGNNFGWGERKKKSNKICLKFNSIQQKLFVRRWVHIWLAFFLRSHFFFLLILSINLNRMPYIFLAIKSCLHFGLCFGRWVLASMCKIKKVYDCYFSSDNVCHTLLNDTNKAST